MPTLPWYLFLSTLIFAPLAFASVETWSIACMEILISLAILSHFFLTRYHKETFYKVPGLIPLLLLLLYMLLQLIPLPPGLVKTFAPAVYQAYAPILEFQTEPQWIPLTVNQKAGLLEFLRISSYSLFYVLTVQLLSKSETLTKTIRIIAWLAAGLAFLAIIQKFTSPQEMYWVRGTSQNTDVLGPWVNRNHYAGFMELVFPLVFALFFHYRPPFSYQQSFRKRLVALFSSPGSNIHFFLWFAVILIIASVFVSLSRGGILALTIGFFFFLLLLAYKESNTGKSFKLLIIAAVLLAVTWFGWDPILSRFNKTFTEAGMLTDGRMLIFKDCAPFIKDFLFTGSGFGTFIHAFQQYNTMPSTAIFDHAHNDYIELLTDGGIIGFSLVACFVVTIFREGLQKLSIRRESYSVLVIIGGLTALFSFLIHSFSDFNMHIGANGLYFFFLCGVLVSAGNTRLHYRTRPSLLQPASPKLALISLTAIPLLLLTITVQGGILQAKKQYKQASRVYLSPQLSEAKLHSLVKKANKAIRLDPLEGHYHYYMGNLLTYLKQDKQALSSYLEASRRNPLEGAYLQRLALLLTPTGPARASLLMAEGYHRSLNKEKLIFIWAEWLLQQDNREEAMTVLQQGVQQFPSLAGKLPALLLGSKYNREEIIAVLPRKAASWIQVGSLAEKLDRLEDAEYYRLHALDFLAEEETIRAHYFTQIYSFYRKQKRTDDAVAILRLGIKWLPEYAPFHIYLGDYYKEIKIPYRAKEEYEQALILDPGNKSIIRRLRTLR
jgi:O-antigen ligase/tetratricopeptide (TPR) repeat protein